MKTIVNINILAMYINNNISFNKNYTIILLDVNKIISINKHFVIVFKFNIVI